MPRKLQHIPNTVGYHADIVTGKQSYHSSLSNMMVFSFFLLSDMIEQFSIMLRMVRLCGLMMVVTVPVLMAVGVMEIVTVLVLHFVITTDHVGKLFDQLLC